jgi:integrase
MAGSLFQRKKDHRYYYIISKGYNPNKNSGKGGYDQQWIDLETTDLKEAKKKADIIKGQIAAGKFHSPAKITLGELFDRWLVHGEKKGLKRRTLEEYRKMIKSNIPEGLKNELIKNIKPKHIRELIESKESQYTKKKIYIIFNSAYKLGLADDDLDLPENPCDRILAPVIKKVKHLTWTADEAKKFLDTTKGTREYGIFLCCLTTGMRIGEVLGLRWKDIDLENKVINISQTLEEKIKGNPRPVFGTPKTDASQAPILMTNLLADELKKVKARQNEEKMKFRKTYKDYDLIFTAFNGSPVHLENLRNRYFNKAIERAGITKIRIHDMRHSAATLLLNMGESLDTIQRYLRHAQRDTTEIYAHNDNVNLLKQATKTMDQIFKESSKKS